MLETLRTLCGLDAVSGDESAVRDYIISEIKDFCDYETDPLGNLLVFKKGKNRPAARLLADAHMDEVGLIITNITDSGFLKFKTVGGIDTAVLMFRRIRINGSVNGVICGKPVHLLGADEKKKLPKPESLYIDIGAETRGQAESMVRVGDRAVIAGEFETLGGRIKSKALDDRIGCAVLMELLKHESEYDFYASFSVQEEIGLRGAKTAAYTVNPQAALVLEATTAADIAGTDSASRVCVLGEGPAVSFMDNSAVYDRAFYKAALESGIKCQPKSAVAGGNNSGAVHLSRGGVRTLAISAPCRYIHSAGSIADVQDIKNMAELARYMINGICSGSIK